MSVVITGFTKEQILEISNALKLMDKNLHNITEIPDAPINGDMLRAMFPNSQVLRYPNRVEFDIKDCSECQSYDLDWWDASYKPPHLTSELVINYLMLTGWKEEKELSADNKICFKNDNPFIKDLLYVPTDIKSNTYSEDISTVVSALAEIAMMSVIDIINRMYEFAAE